MHTCQLPSSPHAARARAKRISRSISFKTPSEQLFSIFLQAFHSEPLILTTYLQISPCVHRQNCQFLPLLPSPYCPLICWLYSHHSTRITLSDLPATWPQHQVKYHFQNPTPHPELCSIWQFLLPPLRSLPFLTSPLPTPFLLSLMDLPDTQRCPSFFVHSLFLQIWRIAQAAGLSSFLDSSWGGSNCLLEIST
jgi:hypothetical protein